MKKKRQLRNQCVVLALSLICAGSASAQFYGATGDGDLFEINTSTGTGTLIGTFLSDGSNEIAYDQTTGTAWAQARDGNFYARTFDLTDPTVTGPDVANGASMHGWEFVGSTLYVAGFAGSISNGFATMDPAIGTASLNIIRNDWDADTNSEVMTGLAYANGTMYAIDNGNNDGSDLYIVSLSDGALTSIGSTGIRAGSLEFGPNGVLYAGGVSANAGNLYSINTSTGVATLVGSTGFGGIGGLMYVGDSAPAVPVPTLPFWLLSLTGALLISTGCRRLRKA